MSLTLYIGRLEKLSARYGAPVTRGPLSAEVSGRVEERRIVLRAGLSLEQQMLTLVHELTHLMVHCHAHPKLNRTICEYEAEAVERWVAAELGVGKTAGDALDGAGVTDNLLACSVLRVQWVARRLVNAARGEDLQSETRAITDAGRRPDPGTAR